MVDQQYQVRIKGHLDDHWLEWLGCLHVTHTTDETILSCVVQDQTALHGLLAKIRDMNLQLISVTRVESKPDPNETKSQGG